MAAQPDTKERHQAQGGADQARAEIAPHRPVEITPVRGLIAPGAPTGKLYHQKAVGWMRSEDADRLIYELLDGFFHAFREI